MKNLIQTLQRFTVSTVSSLLLLSAANGYADDTEIFFGGPAIDSGIRPNVLFVLDNSGSMAWRLDSDNNPYFGEPSRMESLKSAFSDIMQNAGGINVGVMHLNTRTAYPRTMVTPVEYIDKELATNAEQVTAPEMLQSTDDAHMNGTSSGTVATNSQTLPLGATTGTQSVNNSASVFLRSQSDGPSDAFNLSARTNNGNLTRNSSGKITVTTSNTAALYFRDLGIPKEATNVSVNLLLNPASQSANNTVALRLSAERIASGNYFNDGTTLGARNYTAPLSSNQTRWSTTGSNPVRTINITPLITEIQGGIAAGESVGNLALFIENTSTSAREICTPPSCTDAAAPRLSISYRTIAAVGEPKTAGIRFQNVGIPQGATITSATLNFVPAADGTAPAPTLLVKGEASNDALAFGTNSNSLSANSRSRTAAEVRWTPGDWVVTNPPVAVEGPNVTSIVQEVVNRSGWCGNNSMAFYIQPEDITALGMRTANAFDAGGGRQPQLVVNYTTGAIPGCINPIIETRIATNKSDGYESGADVNLVSETLPLTSSSVIGARFEGLPMAKDATILSAHLILTAANDSTVNQTVSARVQSNTGNSTPFITLDGDIEARSAYQSITFPTISAWVSGQEYRSGDIKAGIQAAISAADWAPRNAVGVFVRTAGTTGAEVVAYESNPAQSMRLRIKVQSGGLSDTTRTVRNQINSTVQTFTASGGTPIVPALYDAARYFRGELPGYESPITSACQTSHMVLLTDGAANGNGAQSSIRSLLGNSCTGDSNDGDEQCGRSLIEWMRTVDQTPHILNSDNFITTHTIAFAPDAAGVNTSRQIKAFLTDLANKGGGSYNQANSAKDLAKVFDKIYQEVLSTDTTFVSPGATVNQFNRQTNKNEIYFALFKPSDEDRWPGNLKRYKLTNTTGAVILDADGDVAIDPSTGFFYPDARSFWSAQADGDKTADGGVAANMPNSSTRTVVTYLGNSPATPVNLNSTAHSLATTNSAVTASMVSATDATQRASYINFARGLGSDGKQRKAMGDPLHSVPRLMTYSCDNYTNDELTSCASGEKQVAFIGSNEGFVHAFDTNDGSEKFAFMPQELLKNIKLLYDSGKSTTAKPRPYGMDNSVVLWINDLNENGVIYGGRTSKTNKVALPQDTPNTGEFVYAYATMGRGGRSLYSLDVTDVSNPAMRWFIKGGETTGFSRLGQTWSTPVLTTVNVGGTATKVLLMAGGYDAVTQDEAKKRTADTMGNAIYMINATTGALIWSASSESGHTLQLNKMRYSMPSSIRVIDIDRDGKADQFFVGDMGGQVWRFFINNGNAASTLVTPVKSSGSGTAGADDGVFADVVGTDSGTESAIQLEQKNRRFYNEPSVSLLNVNGTRTMVVSLGSGYRGHPLNKVTKDRFYSFRTPLVYNPTTSAGNSHTTLTESSLYDATSNLVQEGSTSEQQAANTEFAKTSGGWYLRLSDSGEKVLAEAATFAGEIVFTTYEPVANQNSCRAAQGVSRAYTVSLYDATPAAENVVGTPDKSDRYTVLKTSGIPPKPVFLLPGGDSGSSGTGGGDGSKGPWVMCIGTVCKTVDGPSQDSTYWIDEN